MLCLYFYGHCSRSDGIVTVSLFNFESLLCVFSNFAQHNKAKIGRTHQRHTEIGSFYVSASELDSFKKFTKCIFHREALIGMHSSRPKS